MAQLKTFKEVRESFWENHPQFKKDFRVNKRQNDYHTDIRVSFTDYIDCLLKDGKITEKIADNITL